jgi:hypothetical protein
VRKSANNTAPTSQLPGVTATDQNKSRTSLAKSHSRFCDWPRSSWPFGTMDASPLTWWRTMPADLLGDAEHLLLREAIGKIGVLKGPEWVAAMNGDAPASVAIALVALPIQALTLEVDIAMTCLALGALAGSPASALVLSQVLQRTSLDHPFSKELSVSWLVLNLRRALTGTTKPTAQDDGVA